VSELWQSIVAAYGCIWDNNEQELFQEAYNLGVQQARKEKE
jgi:hypothetical protein